MQAANIIELQHKVTLIKSAEKSFQNEEPVLEHGIVSTSVISFSIFSSGVLTLVAIILSDITFDRTSTYVSNLIAEC